MAALLLLSAALVPPSYEARAQSGGVEGGGFVSLAPSAEVSVENRRGGIFVEVWNNEQVGLAAIVHGSDATSVTKGVKGAKRVARRTGLPVSVEHVGEALVIKVERATTAAAPRVDLRLRVPASVRLKVYTSDGEVEVRGVPAALDAQTLSGDLRLALSPRTDATVTAQSLNGSVVIARGIESEGALGRTLRGKLHARLGSGGSTVNLFSGRGRISLDPLIDGAEDVGSVRETGPGRNLETVESSGGSSMRDATRPSRVKQTQEDDGALKVARPRPEPSETPQEVDEDEVVRVESDLVTLNVSVIDRASGRGLQGLSAGEFRVFEDNVEQHLEHFETAEAPFDLLLLLDLSGSTARVTETIRAAARRFVAVTRAQDRVGIIAFAGEATVVSPLTSDRAALRSSLDRLAAPKGDTRLHDSLAYALDFLERGADPSRRRALIVMSDGLDSTLPNVTGVGSTISYEEIRSRVQEFDGVIYAVWMNTEFYEAFSPQDIQPETYDLAHDRMQELAEAGGGTFYEVEKLEDLAGAYERVVADLGTVYSLTYRPTNKRRDGTWRAIRVRLPRRPEAVARGRRGYYAR
jgi:VWFA-related protein